MKHLLIMIAFMIAFDYFKGRYSGFKGFLLMGGLTVALNLGAYYLMTKVFGMSDGPMAIWIMGCIMYTIVNPLIFTIILVIVQKPYK